MAENEEAPPPPPTATLVVEYKRGNILTGVMRRLTEGVLPQPETYLDLSDPSVKSMLTKRQQKKIDETEAAYLNRHAGMMKMSAIESTIKFITAMYNLYMALPGILKLFGLCVIIFLGFVMLPAAIGVYLTIAESFTELVRFSAVVGCIGVMGVLWLVVSVF
jgi:hypothetical protein